MRTVEVSRFVGAPPTVIDQTLDPATIVEYEGSFDVFDIETRDDDWLVTAGLTGLRLTLRFERRENGFYYEQEDAEGQPLETMETTIRYDAENEGSRVTASSTVSMGIRPHAISDRIATWKRKGELKRALAALAADVE
ncbi:MAG: SRPBCC family protein [Natronomonas sp.]